VSLREFWSITGDETKDRYLLLPFGVLVIATMWALPTPGEFSTVGIIVLMLDVLFLLWLIWTWVHHLIEMMRGRG